MTVEQKKDELKCELINLNYFKTPDGRQLYELSLEELESKLKEVKSNEPIKRISRNKGTVT